MSPEPCFSLKLPVVALLAAAVLACQPQNDDTDHDESAAIAPATSVADQTNPVASTGDNIVYAGNELFAANCSACHGVYGEGTGSGTDAYPKPVPGLRRIALANDGGFPRERVRKIIDGREVIDAHNSDTMPRWGSEFLKSEGFSAAAEHRVERKIDALVDFIEDLQEK